MRINYSPFITPMLTIPKDIARLLAPRAPVVINSAPKAHALSSTLPNFRLETDLDAYTFDPYRPFTDYKDLPHINTKKLPKKPTDIRGLDTAAFSHVGRKQMYKNMPHLLRNQFFSLKFFPSSHHLSLARKSNVAYTFSNRGGNVLNDADLQSAFSKYKGEYRKMPFFLTLPTPRDSAVHRGKYRKAVKTCLFESLHRIVLAKEVKMVGGIFFFRFHNSPATAEDYERIRNDLDLAVATLVRDTAFQKLLRKIVQKQNQDFNNGERLLKEVRPENTLGAKRVPGYYPKLPYLRTR